MTLDNVALWLDVRMTIKVDQDPEEKFVQPVTVEIRGNDIHAESRDLHFGTSKLYIIDVAGAESEGPGI